MPTKKSTVKTNKKASNTISQDDLWSKKSDFAIVQRDHSKLFSIISMVVLALVITALGIAVLFAYQNLRNSRKETEDVKKELSETKKDLEERLAPLENKVKAEEKAQEEERQRKVAEEMARGTIEGSLSYPSSYIPKTMKVCAEEVTTKEQACTQEQLVDKKYSYGIGYKLQVKPGKYNVFSTDPSWGDYRAYYSDYVVCGLNSSCSSHNPVDVEVKADQVSNKIDPIDWYNKQ